MCYCRWLDDISRIWHMCRVAVKMVDQTRTYLHAGDTLPSGVQLKFSDMFPHLVSAFKRYCAESDVVFMTCGVTIHGLEYRQVCAIVLEYNDDIPHFAVIEAVIVVDHVKYFVVTKVNCVYEMHILSFTIQETDEQCFLPYCDLVFKWPLPVYNYNGSRAIMQYPLLSSKCFPLFPFPFSSPYQKNLWNWGGLQAPQRGLGQSPGCKHIFMHFKLSNASHGNMFIVCVQRKLLYPSTVAAMEGPQKLRGPGKLPTCPPVSTRLRLN